MRIECGVISKIENGKVLVETAPDSACSSCAAKNGCMVGSDPKLRVIWIENTLGASIGDEVEFSIEEKGVIAASLLLYFFPVVLLMAGILAGPAVLKSANLSETLASVIMGISGLIVSFIIIFIFSRKKREKSIFSPVLVDVTKKVNKLS